MYPVSEAKKSNDVGENRRFNDFQLSEIENTLKEIQLLSDEKRLEIYFKTSIDDILQTIAKSRNIVLKNKTEVDELQSILQEKSYEKRKASVESEKAVIEKRDLQKKAEMARNDLNIIKQAIENITNIASNLDTNEAEIAIESLKPALIRKTTTVERLESELKAAEEFTSFCLSKKEKIDKDFSQIEKSYNTKLTLVNNYSVNLTTSINHILTSFKDLVEISKNVLNSSISAEPLENNNDDNLNSVEYEEMTPA